MAAIPTDVDHTEEAIVAHRALAIVVVDRLAVHAAAQAAAVRTPAVAVLTVVAARTRAAGDYGCSMSNVAERLCPGGLSGSADSCYSIVPAGIREL